MFFFELKYFMKQNYYSAFNEMKMFNIKEHQYAVLTNVSEEKIIVWNNDLTPYPQLLLHQATLLADQPQYSSSNNFIPLKTFNKSEEAWASITKDGNVTTGGDTNFGGDSSSVQFKLKNVKMIFSTGYAFAALLNDGSVLCWGDVNAGGKIPDNIQPQLHNVKMIIPDAEEFTAVCINGDTFTW